MAEIHPDIHYGDDYVLLGMGSVISTLKSSIRVAGRTLTAKEELHTTIFSLKFLVPLISSALECDTDVARQRLVSEVRNTLAGQPISAEDLPRDGEFRILQKEDRRSAVFVPEGRPFAEIFDMTSERLGVVLPLQPAHVTLFTDDPQGRGISVSTYDELTALSQPVSPTMVATVAAATSGVEGVRI